jgi:SHS2 domain-containing protein
MRGRVFSNIFRGVEQSMTKPTEGSAVEPCAELFPHGADVGVRGIGPTREAAFEQAALALSSVITDPTRIASREGIMVACEAPDDAYLLLDWLNALIYEMAVRRVVFDRFAVSIEGSRLDGQAWGEPVDRKRHRPAVEPKGATLTALKVGIRDDGAWVAQCVVDV